ncbi:MAG: ParA family protein [Thermoanaerobaculia bacterium]|nr:ParA family protein [Thermoanaerobaculia bacterium]
MALKIGIISQKGGVGKSTLSRLLAVEYSRNGWEVKIADMDLSQGTVTEWNRIRMENDIEPKIAVEQFMTVKDAIKQDAHYDLLIFDGEPHSTKKTLEIAQACDFMVLPTGVTVDDLMPTIKLAHELKRNGIDRKKIGIALSRVGDSHSELNGAKEYIEEAGYYYLGMLQEKTSIGQAHDSGRAANETAFKSVNQATDQFIQAIVDRMELVKTKA